MLTLIDIVMGFQLFNHFFYCIEEDILKLCGITYEILRQTAKWFWDFLYD